MAEATRIRVGFIGVGVMARVHLGDMLGRDDTEVSALCEPSPAAYAAAANPSPPEVGLRMARLWDAIRESTALGGAVITNPTAARRPLEAAG